MYGPTSPRVREAAAYPPDAAVVPARSLRRRSRRHLNPVERDRDTVSRRHAGAHRDAHDTTDAASDRNAGAITDAHGHADTAANAGRQRRDRDRRGAAYAQG